MTPENFVYWLKGYFELSQHIQSEVLLNESQIKEIKNHLDLVMTKITPSVALPTEPTQLPLPLPIQPLLTTFPPVYPSPFPIVTC